MAASFALSLFLNEIGPSWIGADMLTPARLVSEVILIGLKLCIFAGFLLKIEAPRLRMTFFIFFFFRI